jgi:hypothetical protein
MATPPVSAESTDAHVPAIEGRNVSKDGGFGVSGICATGHGVHGESTDSRGVVGKSEKYHGVYGKSVENVGVAGESDHAEAMNAQSHSSKHAAIIAINIAGGPGVHGHSDNNVGVFGESNTGRGVHGVSNTNYGVSGISKQKTGVLGRAEGSGTGVEGESVSGDGVIGKGRRGVVGESDTFQGVYGHSRDNAGVVGESEEFDGVWGLSRKATAAGVSGHNTAGGMAGFFEGDVVVTGDIRLANADCAEDFDVSGTAKMEPGTVMVLGNEGTLFESQQAHDKRVAGVISGAGDYKPGIVLDKRQSQGNRQPIALMGKVFCKVDAQFGAIEVGDLLTTSPTPGHAMKTSDPLLAFGTVIGKALRPFAEGQGLIPILIALQ